MPPIASNSFTHAMARRTGLGAWYGIHLARWRLAAAPSHIEIYGLQSSTPWCMLLRLHIRCTLRHRPSSLETKAENDPHADRSPDAEIGGGWDKVCESNRNKDDSPCDAPHLCPTLMRGISMVLVEASNLLATCSGSVLSPVLLGRLHRGRYPQLLAS